MNLRKLRIAISTKNETRVRILKLMGPHEKYSHELHGVLVSVTSGEANRSGVDKGFGQDGFQAWVSLPMSALPAKMTNG